MAIFWWYHRHARPTHYHYCSSNQDTIFTIYYAIYAVAATVSMCKHQDHNTIRSEPKHSSATSPGVTRYPSHCGSFQNSRRNIEWKTQNTEQIHNTNSGIWGSGAGRTGADKARESWRPDTRTMLCFALLTAHCWFLARCGEILDGLELVSWPTPGENHPKLPFIRVWSSYWSGTLNTIHISTFLDILM